MLKEDTFEKTEAIRPSEAKPGNIYLDVEFGDLLLCLENICGSRVLIFKDSTNGTVRWCSVYSYSDDRCCLSLTKKGAQITFTQE